MAQHMQLSVVKETGENLIVTVNSSETFAAFQQRLFTENNLFVSIDDFRSLDENLTLDDNFFECLRKNLNDEDLLDFDSPLFEINLLKQNDANSFVLNAEPNVLDETIEELTFERLIHENVSPNYLDIVSQLKEIHSYSEESAADYCRLCATCLDNNRVMIYNSDNCFDEQINNCLPIKVHQDDGLPQNMCEKCAINLGNFYEFMRSVIEAEKVLKLKFTASDEFKTNETEEEYLEVEEIEEISNTQNHHCRICDLIIDNLKDALAHSAEDHQINNLYACVFCEFGFETTPLLSQHIQTEHKDFNSYICKVCGTRFAYKTMLQKHVCGTSKKFQNIKIEYPCDVCNKLFTLKSSLTFHKRSHENKCDACGKIFADKQTLKEHAVLHSDTRPFQCHVCGKHLNRLSRLKSHLQTHASNNLIVKQVHCCVDCKEGFENEHKAIAHKNAENHTIAVTKLDKVYRCEFCEKCYINTKTLKKHRTVHTHVNPYVCHICGAQFPTYSRCTTHKTSHGLFKEGGDKQIFPVIKFFACNSCDNTYLNWTHLTSHKKLKHCLNASTKTKCLDCDLEFPNNYGLTYHRKTKHSEDPIKCSECGENLANYEAWKEHRLALHANKKYNYQCVKCNKIFETQETLEDHLKIHADLKENKCPYCPLSFADVKGLGTHLKIHRIKKSHVAQNTTKCAGNAPDLRPYSCQDCGLTFRKQFTLKNHKLKHCIKLDKSKFVLMVDVAEEEIKSNQKQINAPVINTINNTVNDEIVDEINEVNDEINEEINGGETNEQYIDLGNGNYVRIQPGNTVNIEGKDYFLVEENDDQTMVDVDVDNQHLEENVMQVDDDGYIVDSDTFNQNGITYLLTDNQTY